ncbi:glycosyltransferase [Devosia sp. RR2S18]|uniref:glycosyltransferase n=1 Tax=Devosia rhizosphaerae TaxID=3049774 RepID=UPI0025411876|nr:glycosyltransferase [Devosia sp. RR2S18]WIJ24011.1 glycosyltransferase [Devosia sp. RR2S18]
MRILHVFKTYLPESFAGVERVIWQIAEGCADLGIESEVLSLSRHPAENSVDVGRHFARKSRLLINYASTGLSLDLVGALREQSRAADVVHYHYPWPMMDLAHFLARPARPTLLTYHSDIVRQKGLEKFYSPLRRVFLEQVDHIVATSPNYMQTSPILERYLGKTSVIPIGLDPALQPAPTPERLRSWSERLGSRFFLFVGALRYYKGIQFLIDAAKASGLPLVIVGDGEMHRNIASADLPNITMVGPVADEDKAALLHLCTAFVFPSHLRSEAFGVALLEAAFTGKAMISCELGTGTSYVNVDGETGIVVPPADAEALTYAMNSLWNDQERCASYGRAAAERAHRLFTAQDMTKGYVELYRSLDAKER